MNSIHPNSSLEDSDTVVDLGFQAMISQLTKPWLREYLEQELSRKMSIAHSNRGQLEAIGEYVTRANVDWFAIFPDTLAERESIASANGRKSNLIVYRTRSDDERDHHAIPFTDLTDLLTEDNLTYSEVNGTVRWNVTLKNHLVKVSHTKISVNVERYFQVPLAVEVKNLQNYHAQPIDIEPPSRVATTTYRILRDTVLARSLKVDHKYSCQICGISIELPDGTRYAEVHHVRPLGSPHDGPDIKENMIVLCPNHHAMCDYGALPLSGKSLRPVSGHVVDPTFLDYHNEHVCHHGRSIVKIDVANV